MLPLFLRHVCTISIFLVTLECFSTHCQGWKLAQVRVGTIATMHWSDMTITTCFGAGSSLLEELRAGGDFEGFHNMGLDDHEFEGLTHEMLFTRVHSFPMDNANVRYSLADKPAKTQSKVFILDKGNGRRGEEGSPRRAPGRRMVSPARA